MTRPMPTLERNPDDTFNILVFGEVVERNVELVNVPARMKAHWPEPVRTARKSRKAA
jgi:hypothetical protein